MRACRQCGVALELTAVGQRRYCSTSCTQRSKQVERVAESCKGCGSAFERAKGAPQKFCTPECRRLSRFKASANCKACGSDFTRSLKEAQSNNRGRWHSGGRSKYCSDGCADDGRVLNRYGITVAVRNRLLVEQNGGCAICGTSEPGGMGGWHTDHDHSCCGGDKSCGKCVRGLLCQRCNVGLGLFRDDRTLLRTAAVYLDRVPHAVADFFA